MEAVVPGSYSENACARWFVASMRGFATCEMELEQAKPAEEIRWGEQKA